MVKNSRIDCLKIPNVHILAAMGIAFGDGDDDDDDGGDDGDMMLVNSESRI